MSKIVTDRVMNAALKQHATWRDVCHRGARCVISKDSRREPRTLGGKLYPMVFCDTCGIGKVDEA